MPWLGLLQIPAEVSWRLSGCSSVSCFIQFSGGLQPKQVVPVSLPCLAFPGSDLLIDPTPGIVCPVTHRAPQNVATNAKLPGLPLCCAGAWPCRSIHHPSQGYCLPKCAPVGRVSGALKVRNWETSQGQQSVLVVQLLHCLTIPFPTQASCTYLCAFPPKEPAFQYILRHQGKKATWGDLTQGVLPAEVFC